MGQLHERAKNEWKREHDGRFDDALRTQKRRCQQLLLDALEIPYLDDKGQVWAEGLELVPAHALLPTERYWWGKIAGEIRDLKMVFDTDGGDPSMHRIAKCARCGVDVATDPPFRTLAELGAAIQAGTPSHHDCCKVDGMPPESSAIIA